MLCIMHLTNHTPQSVSLGKESGVCENIEIEITLHTFSRLAIQLSSTPLCRQRILFPCPVHVLYTRELYRAN
jgi:hypothetical protein